MVLLCQVFSPTADTQPVTKSLLHLSSSQYVFLWKVNCLFFVQHLLDGQISWLSLHLLSESVEIPLVTHTKSPPWALWNKDLNKSNCISWWGQQNRPCELIPGCVEQPACRVLAASYSSRKEAREHILSLARTQPCHLQASWGVRYLRPAAFLSSLAILQGHCRGDDSETDTCEGVHLRLQTLCCHRWLTVGYLIIIAVLQFFDQVWVARFPEVRYDWWQNRPS